MAKQKTTVELPAKKKRKRSNPMDSVTREKRKRERELRSFIHSTQRKINQENDRVPGPDFGYRAKLLRSLEAFQEELRLLTYA